MEVLGRDERVFTGCPNLYEALVGFADEKGKWVRGVKLTLYTEGTMIKCAINDPVSNKVGFVTLSPSLMLSEALDEALNPSGIEWRNPRGKQG
jgi:hypothetical protein